MRKLASLFAFVLFATIGFAQTADEVINKFIEATGGKQKLDAINTLQYSQLIKLQSPMGAFELPVDFYKEKGKMARIQSSIQMGPESMNFYTLVNDTAGYIMLPANPFTGAEGGLQKMSAEDRKANLQQTDVQGIFPALVNYAAKGNKVEKLQDAKVNNEDTYKIKLTDATGQETIYYFSKTSNLIVRQDAKGAAAANLSGMGGLMNSMGAGGRIEKMETTILYNNYIDVEGIKFPTKMTIKTAMGDSEAEYSNIKVNQPIDAKWYKAE
ncbi:hypothetical protein [Aridibaculum aurantiacum]|uniref:hypothetical protein n=1 Tax=Aridibaculum aurantiacum TaxID=2810307 RepID=UPI001A95F33A|nr:hypothetical protein [Aridibaculum aurantiacum]